MAVFRIEVAPLDTPEVESENRQRAARLSEAGLRGVQSLSESRLYFLEGELERDEVRRIAAALLADPVCERGLIRGEHDGDPAPVEGRFEVHLRPGVMDPAAESILAELRASGFAVASVRTAKAYRALGRFQSDRLLEAVGRALANDCIEQVVAGSAGVRRAPQPPRLPFQVRTVALRELDSAALEQLSRRGHLFLNLAEMRAIQAHYAQLGRDPTDLELETLAQTWSEHCVHKTMKSAVQYRGAAFPVEPAPEQAVDADDRDRPVSTAGMLIERRYDNLLKETIAKATQELQEERRGAECLSVFQDNAGVIAFDEKFGLAFKVETHNRPSAIEPYGGAATGVGGCIRDVLGCGLGARPIANTDVFCIAPPDWPAEELPRGVLHPRRVLAGVVHGVADYGNRMGIPTVGGAVHFDPRYVGNPLVFCGCLGLIPRDRIEKAARAGDLVVLMGGRTGRDGIHGATFSSAELSDTHADEFSHAVQIGNPITEKRVLDAILRARDADGGSLFTAITDCGAGGLSSAVGEMAAGLGATVDLENVPLKYAGLRYDEIWISEAQERMVLAVPPSRLTALRQIAEEEGVELSVIGVFGRGERGEIAPGVDHAAGGRGASRLVVRYQGSVVGDLDMHFLHEGLPKEARIAEWTAPPMRADQRAAGSSVAGADGSTNITATPDSGRRERVAGLLRRLSTPTIASKEWIIRRYDHEVQGGSVVKPLCGAGRGPGDAAVLRPVAGSHRAVAVGCGLAPQISDLDPYWMAIAAVDEALRNVVCVGGDVQRAAILDNFCWGRTDDPVQLGALVRACQACYDAAKAYGVPFISGKDSLNNEFVLHADDRAALLQTLRGRWDRDALSDIGLRVEDVHAAVAGRVEATGRLAIPPTLLISAVALVDDARKCLTPDFKAPGNSVFVVGGLPPTRAWPRRAARVHTAMSSAIAAGLASACHDCSDGGWLAALAEMAISGEVGVEVAPEALRADDEFKYQVAAYLVEARDSVELERLIRSEGMELKAVGRTIDSGEIVLANERVGLQALRAAWRAAPPA